MLTEQSILKSYCLSRRLGLQHIFLPSETSISGCSGRANLRWKTLSRVFCEFCENSSPSHATMLIRFVFMFCRNQLSMSQDLLPGRIFMRKECNYSSSAWMVTWTARWRRHRRIDTSPMHLARPLFHGTQGFNRPFRNHSIRYVYVT